MSCQLKRSLGLGLALLASPLFASGFQLFESSGVTVGDYGAGLASSPEDASIGYNNPAGLVHLDRQQLVFSQTFLSARGRFQGQAKASVEANPLITDTYDEHGRTKDNSWHFIPAAHVAVPISPNLTFGLGMTVPFGLSTNWGEHSLVRYEATKSQITTLNVGPSLGYRVNDWLSVGGGVDLQYLRMSLDLMTYSGLAAPGQRRPDGRSKNRASSFAIGANVGVMLHYCEHTNVGLHGRLPVRHRASGRSEASRGLLAHGTTIRSDLRANVTMPGTLNLGATHRLTDRVSLKINTTYTHWSSIKRLVMKNVVTPAGNDDIAVTQNLRNTWRLALGFDYRIHEQWLLRAGAGFDQSPVKTAERIIRLPDNNRYALAAGFRYQFNQQFGFDMGYTHVFIKKASINHTQHLSTQTSTLIGDFNGSADLLSAQLTWYF